MKEEITTENTTNTEESPEQPMLPGMEELAAQAETRPLGSVSKSVGELAEENEALKNEIRMRDAVDEVRTRLAQAGAKSPGLLTGRSKESFQFSDEGVLINAEAVLQHLRKTYPEQFPGWSIDATAGRTPRPTLTKEALARMTPAEIQQLDWSEVKATLAS